jgi:hypothetical protein
MSYSRKLRDPKWLAKRQEVLKRDGNRCVNDPNHRMPIEVHHLSYIQNREPWEYPLDNFLALCRDCHLAEHKRTLTVKRPIRLRGEFYGWHQIEMLTGYEPRGFLTEIKEVGKNSRVVCGCFKLDLNPDAPDIVLPGSRNDWLEKARLFQKQGSPIPVFVKGEGLPWEYVGFYDCETITINPMEIAIHQKLSGRNDIGCVMFLAPESINDSHLGHDAG